MEAYERFKALVDSGNLFAAGQMLRDTVPGYPKVMVLVQSCSIPQQHESVIMANRLNFNEKENKVKIQKLMRARINAVQYANFLSGASAPRPELAPSEQPAA